MVHLHRIETEGLAQVSFVIAAANGDALVIDPRRDVEVFLDLAQAHDLTLRYVADTHLHADYASGAPELAQRSGARLLLRGITNGGGGGAVAAGEATDPLVVHGGVLQIGELRVTALHTPGHTPEHRCFLVEDTSDATAAPLLFSGDTLFVGSVGRPDLLGSDETQELAAAMLTSLLEVLAPLPDATIVHPGHGAGSACGGGIGGAPSSTIGQERSTNPYFQFNAEPGQQDAFVARLLSDLPPVPPYFPIMKRLNARGAAPRSAELPPALATADLLALQHPDAAATTLIDVRDATTFAEGHLRGSLNIGSGGSLATWAGWTVPYDRPIVLLAQHHDQVQAAQRDLARIGLDDVSGYAIIADPAVLDDWRAEGVAIQRLTTYTPAEANAATEPLQILDIRNASEWDEVHIPGSHHLPLEALAQGATLAAAGIDPDAPIAVICASGYRSSLAASLLQRQGRDGVSAINGGINAWRLAELPVAGGADAISDHSA